MTPNDSYYAVIFSSTFSGEDPVGYAAMTKRMQSLAQSSPGFIDIESARDTNGFGVTVSYWRSLADINTWRTNLDHLEAQRLGQDRWYGSYTVRITKVLKSYSS